MSNAKTALLERITEEVATNGLADRSLREIAEAAGTSHRMLLYHFGDRAGLVAAIVQSTEAAQRQMLLELAGQVGSAEELIRALWSRVSAEEMLPFVRLFFECVAATGGEGLTDPWIADGDAAAESLADSYHPDQIRLGVAVTRGLLIDVLGSGSSEDATRSLELFIKMWREIPDSRDPDS